VKLPSTGWRRLSYETWQRHSGSKAFYRSVADAEYLPEHNRRFARFRSGA
jgi:hypothetical protein